MDVDMVSIYEARTRLQARCVCVGHVLDTVQNKPAVFRVWTQTRHESGAARTQAGALETGETQ